MGINKKVSYVFPINHQQKACISILDSYLLATPNQLLPSREALVYVYLQEQLIQGKALAQKL